MAYENVKRDGTASLLKLATLVCGITNAFGYIIEAKYPADSPIGLLYTTAKLLCTQLPAARDYMYDPQGGNDIPEDNPELIPGINPAAPPPPAIPDPE